MMSVLGIVLLLMGCGPQTETIVLQKQELDAVQEEQQSQEQNESDEKLTEDFLDTSENATEEKSDVYVYICGAVYYPGVYRLEKDARVFEAIALAGGLCEDACLEAINQAQQVQDGQRIVVPTRSQWEKEGADFDTESAATAGDALVNINTADVSKLCELSGIGEAKAEAIIKYRQENGNFSSVDEIKNVTGIGEGLFNRIRDKIKI